MEDHISAAFLKLVGAWEARLSGDWRGLEGARWAAGEGTARLDGAGEVGSEGVGRAARAGREEDDIGGGTNQLAGDERANDNHPKRRSEPSSSRMSSLVLNEMSWGELGSLASLSCVLISE